MVLKNYRYVFLLTHIEPGDGDDRDAFGKLSVEPSIYADERSLPAGVTATEIRKAREAIGKSIFSVGTMSFLTYCPIQGK